MMMMEYFMEDKSQVRNCIFDLKIGCQSVQHPIPKGAIPTDQPYLSIAKGFGLQYSLRILIQLGGYSFNCQKFSKQFNNFKQLQRQKILGKQFQELGCKIVYCFISV
eukprot:TRINITY_DN48821_c0_g1_i1.p7 TRINITY_DN48821_c0_g1~~TRINITY_DN48821_c0_g1_i1.p7  ORF type:complete len:107 (+),score=0.61 TRINITY_DN48821_c0_g1_i1:1018-1338(+)